MAMNEWYSYVDRKQALVDKDKPKHPITVSNSHFPATDQSQMHVEESVPSDTFIQKMRQGILDRLK